MSFVFLAEHQDQEGGSVVQQLTIGKIDRENELEKIRNAETGKPRKKIRLLHSSWLLGETHSRFKPGKASVGIFLCFSGENLDDDLLPSEG